LVKKRTSVERHISGQKLRSDASAPPLSSLLGKKVRALLLPARLVHQRTDGAPPLRYSFLAKTAPFYKSPVGIDVTPKLLALMAFLAVYLATTKQGYAPIAMLPLLLPARLFPFQLKKVWLWRLVFGGGLVVVSLWYLGATAHIAEVIHQIQRPGLHVDESEQLHHIFQNPLKFLSMIFIQPFTIWSGNIYAGIVGVVTNKLVKLPIPVMLLSYMALLVTVFHRERSHVNGRDRLYVLACSTGAFLATFTLINLALYLSFTRVGYDHVEGLQGRYFLALLPLLGIILHTAMPKLFLKISDGFMNLLAYPAIVIGLVTTTLLVF